MSFIETDRLLIRTWMAADAQAMAPIFGDAETMRYVGAGYQRGWTLEETRAEIARMTAAYESDGIGIWPVVLKETGAIVGECGLQPLPCSEDAEIAFVFDRSRWGAGYAYEAASAVLHFGFEGRRLPRIAAVAHPFNKRSIALIDRLGMRFDRVVRVYKADLLKYVKEAS